MMFVNTRSQRDAVHEMWRTTTPTADRAAARSPRGARRGRGRWSGQARGGGHRRSISFDWGDSTSYQCRRAKGQPSRNQRMARQSPSMSRARRCWCGNAWGWECQSALEAARRRQDTPPSRPGPSTCRPARLGPAAPLVEPTRFTRGDQSSPYQGLASRRRKVVQSSDGGYARQLERTPREADAVGAAASPHPHRAAIRLNSGPSSGTDAARALHGSKEGRCRPPARFAPAASREVRNISSSSSPGGYVRLRRRVFASRACARPPPSSPALMQARTKVPAQGGKFRLNHICRRARLRPRRLLVAAPIRFRLAPPPGALLHRPRPDEILVESFPRGRKHTRMLPFEGRPRNQSGMLRRAGRARPGGRRFRRNEYRDSIGR